MKNGIRKIHKGESRRSFLVLSIYCAIMLLFTFTFTHDAVAHLFYTAETQITTDPSDQFDPSISGTKIAYSDLRDADANIYFYDIESQTETPITYLGGDQLLNDISGNLVVFTDYGEGNADIYVYNCVTEVLEQITDDPVSQRNPAISGNLIVFEDNRNGDFDIYLYNFATGIETRLTDDDGQQIKPVISGTIVAWEDYRNENADIYMLDLSTGVEIPIARNAAAERDPDVDGDIITFTTDRSSPGDVYYYRISTGEMVAVTNGFQYQRNPAVSGDCIAYEDWGDDNSDIFVYHIPLAVSECVIADVNHQYLHDISGNRIVYTDDRNGNLDLYLSEFSFHNVEIDVSPLVYDFGEVETGTSSSFIVSISNVGFVGFLSGHIYFEEGSNPDFTSVPSTIPILIDAGQTLDVVLTYTPSNIGIVEGTLLIESNDLDEPLVAIELTGTGVSYEAPPSQQINDILTFIDVSIANETLVGTGPGNSALNRIKALKNMIESAGDHIESGDLEKACEQLYNIYLKMDGAAPPISPPDFVGGDAREELENMILKLMQDIGC